MLQAVLGLNLDTPPEAIKIAAQPVDGGAKSTSGLKLGGLGRVGLSWVDDGADDDIFCVAGAGASAGDGAMSIVLLYS